MIVTGGHTVPLALTFAPRSSSSSAAGADPAQTACISLQAAEAGEVCEPSASRGMHRDGTY